MPVQTEPSPWVQQLSGNDPAGRPVLSVLAKRSYRWVPSAGFVPEPESATLVEEPVFDDEDLCLEADTDLFPLKPATDLVVHGSGYNHGRHASGVCDVALVVGSHGRLLRLFGPRRVARSATGALLFSDPEPFEQVPLTYALAYGGRDTAAERESGFPWPEVFGSPVPGADSPPDLASPFLYPRNPAGLGYLVEATPAGIEALQLPRIEDAHDLLTPARLVAGDPGNWPRQPLPGGMGWLSYEWFPRIGCMGIVPPYLPEAGAMAEIARGYAPADIGDPFSRTTEKAFRFTCGASLGLQVPHLRGGEVLQLHGLSPRAPTEQWILPPAPRIHTDGRQGRLQATEAVLHTAVLEPDAGRLTLVWRGAAPALRAYLPDELKRMPLRVEWSD